MFFSGVDNNNSTVQPDHSHITTVPFWASKDLMQKYHSNGVLVQELINGKLVAGQWKDHPEFPGKEDSKLKSRVAVAWFLCG